MPPGRPSVIVADITVPSGTASIVRSCGSTSRWNMVSTPPYPYARAASSRFWHAG